MTEAVAAALVIRHSGLILISGFGILVLIVSG
jgi:hypothetical protein